MPSEKDILMAEAELAFEELAERHKLRPVPQPTPVADVASQAASRALEAALQTMQPDVPYTWAVGTRRALNGEGWQPARASEQVTVATDSWQPLSEEAKRSIREKLGACWPLPGTPPVGPATLSLIDRIRQRVSAIVNDPAIPVTARTVGGEMLESGVSFQFQRPPRGCTDGGSGWPATTAYFTAAGLWFNADAIADLQRAAAANGDQFRRPARIDVPVESWWDFPLERVRWRGMEVRVLDPDEPEPVG